MTTYSTAEALQALCRLEGKWGVYLNAPHGHPHIFLKVAEIPIDDNAREELALRGQVVVLFDTKEEMEALYRECPDSYDGGIIYAMTVGPDGEMRNENT